MGDAFTDSWNRPEPATCKWCSGKFRPDFGCGNCRRDQRTGEPWDTPKKTRDAINRQIKGCRQIIKDEHRKYMDIVDRMRKEIREAQARRRRVTKANPTGMVKIKIDTKALEEYWEPGRSLWDPKRKEK